MLTLTGVPGAETTKGGKTGELYPTDQSINQNCPPKELVAHLDWGAGSGHSSMREDGLDLLLARGGHLQYLHLGTPRF